MPFEVVQPIQHLAEQQPCLPFRKGPPVRDQVKQLAFAVERRHDVNALIVP